MDFYFTISFYDGAMTWRRYLFFSICKIYCYTSYRNYADLMSVGFGKAFDCDSSGSDERSREYEISFASVKNSLCFLRVFLLYGRYEELC